MMHSEQALYDELRSNLAEIEKQIHHIKKEIALDYPKEELDKLNVWYWTRDRNGGYVLAPLLMAKAQVLSGMAALKVSANQKRSNIVSRPARGQGRL